MVARTGNLQKSKDDTRFSTGIWWFAKLCVYNARNINDASESGRLGVRHNQSPLEKQDIPKPRFMAD